MLLALVQAITRPYDFYVASLLFFGLTIMALTTVGRETSLNTFSLLLAQPAERMRIWQTKLSVLAVAFLTVFAVWLAAFGVAFAHSNVDASDREVSYNLFITICLIATATFTGGLWTTLLLRQLAGAFWLTLLVPATLSGFSGAFLAAKPSPATPSSPFLRRLRDLFGWRISVCALAVFPRAGRGLVRRSHFAAGMEIFRGALGKCRFNPEPETHFRADQKRISIATSQLDGGGWIAGAAHRRHRPAKISSFCQRFRRRNPHGDFLDVVAGHGPGDRQHGRGRGTAARRDGRAVVPAGFAPGSVRHQRIFDFVSRHFPRRRHADVAGRHGRWIWRAESDVHTGTYPGVDFSGFHFGVVAFSAWLVLVSFFASTLCPKVFCRPSAWPSPLFSVA